MISESQWTPEKNLPRTIKAMNTAMIPTTQCFTTWLRMRFFSCRIATGITHITSMVVEEG